MAWRIIEGPLPGPWDGVDAVSWVWRVANEADEATSVRVDVSGTAMAVAPEYLPADTRAARATEGRTEVERLLNLDVPPARIALGTAGRVQQPPGAEQPGWWVLLRGRESDLRRLAAMFPVGGGEVRIYERPGAFYLRADVLEELADQADVLSRAVELLRRVNGVGRLVDEAAAPVEIDRVERVLEGGGRQHFVGLRDTAAAISDSLSVTVARAEGSRVQIENTDQDSSAAGIFEIAAQDEGVARALLVVGRADLNWADLYHLYEVVLADVGGRIYDEGWASRTEVERFKRTANSPAVLGEEARHGRETTDPPPNPMSRPDATALVVGLARRWIADKVRSD